MKTNIAPVFVSLLTLAVAAPAAFAQDEANDNISYEAPDASTVVYDQPVAYYASVVYQAPVVYNAPVFYIAAGAAAAVSYRAPCQHEPEAPTSTVVVVGGRGGTYSYSNQPATACNDSTVVLFGQRGGWFGGRW